MIHILIIVLIYRNFIIPLNKDICAHCFLFLIGSLDFCLKNGDEKDKACPAMAHSHDVSVSGLEVGRPVNYLGITSGTISEIIIDPGDVSSVITGENL